MARGGLEVAVWDLEARRAWQAALPAHRRRRAARDSLRSFHRHPGFRPAAFRKNRNRARAGYQRIKMKIKPGWDVDVVRQKCASDFPNILLMADANSAYTLADAERLKAGRIQPHDDRAAARARRDHRPREAAGATQDPICLDECIRSAHQAEQAIAMDAGRIINIKLGRVGGFAEAKRVHDVAQAAGIPVWCGGMLESGIGRAHNIALSTLPNFTLPGDVSASKRYWTRDIIQPARGSHAARNHRRSRRAGLRLRARSRIYRFHHRPPGTVC
jgi:O-succinylbenzoate synthase